MELTFVLASIFLRFMLYAIILISIGMIIHSLKRKYSNKESMMERSMNKENRPTDNVLVPDNVKKESQDKSTQKEDAKRYNVQYEKKMLETKGYIKENDSYKKSDSTKQIVEKEFDPINSDENCKPLNDDEDNDDPIKNL